MKKLMLIRHAKAADETSEGDFARPLKKSGREDAHELAKQLKKHDLVPQLMITSPALRAKTTAEIIAEHNNIPMKAPVQGIYEASDRALLKIINELPNEFDFIALTGHNPAVSMVSTFLSAQYHSMPTCGAVLIKFDLEGWNHITATTGASAWTFEP